MPDAQAYRRPLVQDLQMQTPTRSRYAAAQQAMVEQTLRRLALLVKTRGARGPRE